MSRWSDRDLFWTIQNGIRMTGMPAWRSSLTEQQTWDVVAYIRHLSEQSGKRSAPGTHGTSDADLRRIAQQTIEDEGCRDCHTIDGVGARIGPNLSDEWARGRSDAWLIGHFRHPSAYTPGTPMPSFDHLSDVQLKALVRYLQDSSK
jgi:mono/diheme cytochrome c family protein